MDELKTQLITVVIGVIGFFFGKFWDKKAKQDDDRLESEEAFKQLVHKALNDLAEFKIELRFKLDSIKHDTKPIEKLVKDMNALHARVRVVESRIDS